VSNLRTRFAAKAARTLRSNSTEAERKLWANLRDRRLGGFKFVRQEPVGPYIADFACRDADLIVELDGSQHVADAAYDERRSQVLAEHGYRVLRFWNNNALGDTEAVLAAILIELQKAPSPGLRHAKPDLSPKGEVAAHPTHPGTIS
jgi:very-short-patch-repair endonuclease